MRKVDAASVDHSEVCCYALSQRQLLVKSKVCYCALSQRQLLLNWWV